MNKYAIEAQAVCKRFSDGTGHSIDVLSGVTFAAAPGEVLAIVGASGSGKSDRKSTRLNSSHAT